mmetsp:Transcript_21655/g.63605  ORF Transcript_21655/g.63605 Transcript_21655/m.63605 type:complete len:662 (+) Transcript_21655:1761-3746(+)
MRSSASPLLSSSSPSVSAVAARRRCTTFRNSPERNCWGQTRAISPMASVTAGTRRAASSAAAFRSCWVWEESASVSTSISSSSPPPSPSFFFFAEAFEDVSVPCNVSTIRKRVGRSFVDASETTARSVLAPCRLSSCTKSPPTARSRTPAARVLSELQMIVSSCGYLASPMALTNTGANPGRASAKSSGLPQKCGSNPQSSTTLSLMTAAPLFPFLAAFAAATSHLRARPRMWPRKYARRVLLLPCPPEGEEGDRGSTRRIHARSSLTPSGCRELSPSSPPPLSLPDGSPSRSARDRNASIPSPSTTAPAAADVTSLDVGASSTSARRSTSVRTAFPAPTSSSSSTNDASGSRFSAAATIVAARTGSTASQCLRCRAPAAASREWTHPLTHFFDASSASASPPPLPPPMIRGRHVRTIRLSSAAIPLDMTCSAPPATFLSEPVNANSLDESHSPNTADNVRGSSFTPTWNDSSDDDEGSVRSSMHAAARRAVRTRISAAASGPPAGVDGTIDETREHDWRTDARTREENRCPSFASFPPPPPPPPLTSEEDSIRGTSAARLAEHIRTALPSSTPLMAVDRAAATSTAANATPIRSSPRSTRALGHDNSGPALSRNGRRCIDRPYRAASSSPPPAEESFPPPCLLFFLEDLALRTLCAYRTI